MSRSHDETCLRQSIRMSAQAVAHGNMPFGAVLANAEGTILRVSHNLSAAKKERGGAGDVTRHAEMELIRMVADIDMETRKECTIYASTEPCVMCAGAIYWSGIGRLVFGASSEELCQLSGPGGFDIPVKEIYSLGRPGTRVIEIEGPLLSEEAMQVHKESGIWKGIHEPNMTPANADIETERSLFSSGLGAAEATGNISVPIIDLSQESDDVIAEELWNAATTVGFFTLIGHGIPKEVIEDAFQVSVSFFSQPEDVKSNMSPFSMELNSGYEYMSQVRPSTGTADQKESLQITAREGAMDGRWPSFPSNFRQVIETLTVESHTLAVRLLNLMESKACPNVEPGTLAKSNTLWEKEGQCTLRMLHYMPMNAESARKLTTPDEDGRTFWRAGAHTDWDEITLLFQRVGQAGLECCSTPCDTSKQGAQWTSVHPLEGGITVNIGDMLARWSGGRLYSNLHRVRMPTEEECTPPTSRYSIAFFAQADKTALIDDGISDPISAGDYILSRIKSNFPK